MSHYHWGWHCCTTINCISPSTSWHVSSVAQAPAWTISCVRVGTLDHGCRNLSLWSNPFQIRRLIWNLGIFRTSLRCFSFRVVSVVPHLTTFIFPIPPGELFDSEPRCQARLQRCRHWSLRLATSANDSRVPPRWKRIPEQIVSLATKRNREGASQRKVLPSNAGTIVEPLWWLHWAPCAQMLCISSSDKAQTRLAGGFVSNHPGPKGKTQQPQQWVHLCWRTMPEPRTCLRSSKQPRRTYSEQNCCGRLRRLWGTLRKHVMMGLQTRSNALHLPKHLNN